MTTERIRQADITVIAMRLAQENGGRITTAELVEKLTRKFNPVGDDAVPIQEGRGIRFEQVVRNLISNRGTSQSMFELGYAEYVREEHGFVLTKRGEEFLETCPR